MALTRGLVAAALATAAAGSSLLEDAAKSRNLAKLHARRAELLSELAEVEESLGGDKTKGRLENQKAGECLTCQGACDVLRGDLKLKPCDDNDKDQLFKIKKMDGHHRIESSKGNLCVDVDARDDTTLQMWECHDDYGSQQFKIETDGSWDTVKNKDLKKCLTSKNGVTAVECDSSDNHHMWRFHAVA
eukprot:TRINITY_DN39016_c0_g1_i1.p1 TRINITY_DN39016_c0_g1~~TRINITY_DN39016_c0_g1_i1.p1  ORF type:complete len:208 (-),score=51.69 TRINITY_DN39016_c0_g1_i1:124-687(-)